MIEIFENEQIKEEMPEIKKIFIGGCGANKRHRGPPPQFNGVYITAVAHTHICPNDSSFKTICCPHKDLLIKDNKFTDILWHEYAHVLETDEVLKNIRKIECLNSDAHNIYWISKNNIINDDHGEIWKKIMLSLGKDPTVYANLTMEDAALIKWQELPPLIWSD